MSEARRAELLRQARAVFAQHGYRNTTTRLLAAELGITAGTLYHYVDSKPALLAEVFEEVREPMRRVLADALALDAPAVERLRYLARHHARAITRDPLGVQLVLTELESLEADARVHAEAELREYRVATEAMIAEGQADGALRTDQPAPLLAQLLIGALNWSVRWYRPDGPQRAESVGDAAVDLLLAGMTPAGTPATPAYARV